MSNSYRAPPSDIDLRPLYRSRPESSSSSSTANVPHGETPGGDWSNRPPSGSQWTNRSSPGSDWSNRPSSASHWSTDGALSVLNSCGLDASDLSLLAQLPEDMLTVKSLPHLLSQIKGKKKDPNPPGYQPSGSAPRQLPGQSHSSFSKDSLASLDNRLWNYKPSSSSAAVSSSATTGFVVDYGHRVVVPEYGKTPERPIRNAKPSQAFSSHGQKEHRGLTKANQRTGFVKMPATMPPSSAVSATAPTEKQARDFHGRQPSTFPYNCSLCNITVLSESNWNQHISGSRHADGQLSLLRLFPSWDCRMTSVSRSEHLPEKKEDESKEVKKKREESNQMPQKKSLKGKVVCVKFPAHSLDEAKLRKLSQQFGEIANVAMFPSLGFIELGSMEQAQNLVTFYSKTSPSEIREKIEFSISNTFNFLQSSFVVSFSPVPFGKEGQSDLINVVRRFGTPLYTMFQPTQMQAFMEMQNAADAHKLVEYYSDSTLKINGVSIKVSFSQEYRSLQRCALAKPYEEESEKKEEPKRPQRTRNKNQRDEKTRSESRDKTRSESRDKTRSESREKTQSESRDKTLSESREKTRSQSRDKTLSESRKKTRNESRDKTRSESREKTRNESREKTRSESRDKTRSESREKTRRESREKTRSESRDKTQCSERKHGSTETEKKHESGKKAKENVKEQSRASKEKEQTSQSQEKMSSIEGKEAQSKAETGQKEPTEQTQDLSEEGSDVEGLQVMGEHLDEEGDTEFMFDLENCITLDEVHESDEEEKAERTDKKEDDPRVVFLGNLPMHGYCDSEFIKLLTTFGKPVRYVLNQFNRMALVEMESAAAAQDFSWKMKKQVFLGSPLNAFISEKYTRLYSGFDIRSYLSGVKSSSRSSVQSSRPSPERTQKDVRKTRREASKQGPTGKKSLKLSDKEPSAVLKQNSSATKTEQGLECMKKESEENDDEGWVVYDEMDESDAEQESETKDGERSEDPSTEEGRACVQSLGEKRSLDEEELMSEMAEEEETEQSETSTEENAESEKRREKSAKKTAPKDKESTNKMEGGWSVCEIKETEAEGKDSMLEKDKKEAVEDTVFNETDGKAGNVSTNKMADGEESRLEVQEFSDEKDLLMKVGESQESVDKMAVEEEEGSSFSHAKEQPGDTSTNKMAAEQEPGLKVEPEEGWLVSNWSTEEEFKSWDETVEENGDEEEAEGKNASKNSALKEGDKAVKRKGIEEGETESGPEKKRKEAEDAPRDLTEGGATEKNSNKPIGTEFIRFYCNLCHVIYSDETEAREMHCSSEQHYRKYQEITGKDPWTS